MDFFDYVPDSFFSLLASKNKRIYLSSILEVFKVYETGSILGIDKKIVVDDLVYYYEAHSDLLFDKESDNEDDEANPQSKRDLANFVLRRMEECGWIYIDVNNDYEEILNFTDMAITVCECLLKVFPQFELGEIPADYVSPDEYQGYIYSIYSLLNQSDNIEYALTFSLVYSNTKHLIRAIRRLDARMKEYITSVIENSEIKNLMENLIIYKNDIYDNNYKKLKISDNINRYRLSIISNLNALQESEVAVKAIAKNYISNMMNEEQAINKAIKNIDEVIDAFNAIDGFINEIDNKNRNYINSTIGKIKFLLSEEDNVIGKLNTVLKYIKDQNKAGKIDKAIRLAESIVNIKQQKLLSENSLYTPRGSYERNLNQTLDSDVLEFELTPDFLAQFKSAYNEEKIEEFLSSHLDGNIFVASSIINPDCDNDTFMNVVYSVILAVEKNYRVELKNDLIGNKRYCIKNFIISKGGIE